MNRRVLGHESCVRLRIVVYTITNRSVLVHNVLCTRYQQETVILAKVVPLCLRQIRCLIRHKHADIVFAASNVQLSRRR